MSPNPPAAATNIMTFQPGQNLIGDPTGTLYTPVIKQEKDGKVIGQFFGALYPDGTTNILSVGDYSGAPDPTASITQQIHTEIADYKKQLAVDAGSAKNAISSVFAPSSFTVASSAAANTNPQIAVVSHTGSTGSIEIGSHMVQFGNNPNFQSQMIAALDDSFGGGWSSGPNNTFVKETTDTTGQKVKEVVSTDSLSSGQIYKSTIPIYNNVSSGSGGAPVSGVAPVTLKDAEKPKVTETGSAAGTHLGGANDATQIGIVTDGVNFHDKPATVRYFYQDGAYYKETSTNDGLFIDKERLSSPTLMPRAIYDKYGDKGGPVAAGADTSSASQTASFMNTRQKQLALGGQSPTIETGAFGTLTFKGVDSNNNMVYENSRGQGVLIDPNNKETMYSSLSFDVSTGKSNGTIATATVDAGQRPSGVGWYQNGNGWTRPLYGSNGDITGNETETSGGSIAKTGTGSPDKPTVAVGASGGPVTATQASTTVTGDAKEVKLDPSKQIGDPKKIDTGDGFTRKYFYQDGKYYSETTSNDGKHEQIELILHPQNLPKDIYDKYGDKGGPVAAGASDTTVVTPAHYYTLKTGSVEHNAINTILTIDGPNGTVQKIFSDGYTDLLKDGKVIAHDKVNQTAVDNYGNLPPDWRKISPSFDSAANNAGSNFPSKDIPDVITGSFQTHTSKPPIAANSPLGNQNRSAAFSGTDTNKSLAHTITSTGSGPGTPTERAQIVLAQGETDFLTAGSLKTPTTKPPTTHPAASSLDLAGIQSGVIGGTSLGPKTHTTPVTGSGPGTPTERAQIVLAQGETDFLTAGSLKTPTTKPPVTRQPVATPLSVDPIDLVKGFGGLTDTPTTKPLTTHPVVSAPSVNPIDRAKEFGGLTEIPAGKPATGSTSNNDSSFESAIDLFRNKEIGSTTPVVSGGGGSVSGTSTDRLAPSFNQSDSSLFYSLANPATTTVTKAASAKPVDEIVHYDGSGVVTGVSGGDSTTSLTPENVLSATSGSSGPTPPPAYTGGAPVQSYTQNLTTGVTQTITANGAVIDHKADGTSYRAGWVDPSNPDLSNMKYGDTNPWLNENGGAGNAQTAKNTYNAPASVDPASQPDPVATTAAGADNNPATPAWRNDGKGWSASETSSSGDAKAAAFDPGATILETRPGNNNNGNTVYRMSDGTYESYNPTTGDIKGAGTWNNSQWNTSAYSTPTTQIANTDTGALDNQVAMPPVTADTQSPPPMAGLMVDPNSSSGGTFGDAQ